MNSILIGGLQKQSLIDYPGHISAIVFTCGCNFRCDYCHNPELVFPDKIKQLKNLKTDSILEWIKSNKIMLDAIVVTGGEPTLHRQLPAFLKAIKQLGIKVKLDTNGSRPAVLAQCIDQHLVDYVAMDIKAPLDLSNYQKVVGSHLSEEEMRSIIRSKEILENSAIAYEFRTTLHHRLTIADLRQITNQVKGQLYFQQLHFNEKFIDKHHSSITGQELKQISESKNDRIQIAIRE